MVLLLSNLSSPASLIKTLSRIHADKAVANRRQRQLADRARLGRLLLPGDVVGSHSDANEYDTQVSDNDAEEDSIPGMDISYKLRKSVFRLGEGLKAQADANESRLVFDFTALTFDKDDIQDDVKVQSRIDFLLHPGIARCYWYSPEIDAVIEAATPIF
ncbi:uncharacterized protein TrAtP1_009865 [Trichoderma atroviride]|uniref:Uncharacterized protein n=1 Tax=Hypocrea atroviridis (strain ATCC 20476 / IMI 206040) TaxID=452589 RepID=G9NKH5_HYPAI|nr:uncharacterized protein TRIATDRAFT_305222 [Trichoderma atroviride IMI 206040]EHK48398.1 hypothetical protein TRIATDRAFT_305222 [Trichoderma atroviride IMI 206040]UKZ68845.1 hypothetical protein TrAtP1_009865 [Trichoderma atroviride]